jgi:hypothetical protein
MPFTFSHPALVLPFLNTQRRWLSASGLIAGSLVPDFEYFLRMRKGLSHYSHTWPGLFWFDLPFAVLLTYLFHLVVRTPLLHHLPGPLFSRFAGINAPDWPRELRRRWPVVLLSILIGTLTHFGWDWFVHRSSDYLHDHQRRLFPLDAVVSHAKVYATVHLAHTVVGLAALAWVVWRLPVSPLLPQSRSYNSAFWTTIALLTATIAAIRIRLGIDMYLQDWLAAVLAAFLLALTVVCLWVYLTKNRNNRLLNSL